MLAYRQRVRLSERKREFVRIRTRRPTHIPVIVDPEGNGKGVLILSDALNHSSIVEGVRGSGAKVVPFAHNDVAHLEAHQPGRKHVAQVAKVTQ